jgi:hypothetical protein
MSNEIMIPSLVELGLLAAGLAAVLALFLSVKQEIHAQARKHRTRMDQMLQQLQDAQRLLLENGASEGTDGNQAAAFPYEVRRSGMNLSKRVQAERLMRRGEDVSHVAAALGVSRREIELLMRVQRLSARRAAGAGS